MTTFCCCWSETVEETNAVGETSRLLPSTNKRKPLMFGNLDLNTALGRDILIYTLILGYAAGCGQLYVTAVGAELSEIADNVGKSSTELDYIFLARGAGAVLALIASTVSGLSLLLTQQTKIVVFLAIAVPLILSIAFISTASSLYLIYGGMGFCLFLSTQGVFVRLRAVHRRQTGVWIGPIGLFYLVIPAIAPLVQLFTTSLLVDFAVVGIVVFSAVLAVGVAMPVVEDGAGDPLDPSLQLATTSNNNSSGGSNDCKDAVNGAEEGADTEPSQAADKKPTQAAATEEASPPHYWVELICGVVIVAVVGSTNIQLMYLETYVTTTSAIPSDDGAALLLVDYTAQTVGSVLAVFLQMFYPFGNVAVLRLLTILMLLGSFFTLCVALFPSSGGVLWSCVAIYNFCETLSYVYAMDIQSRFTMATEWSSLCSTIAMILFGGSLVPFVVVELWSYLDYPQVMFLYTTVMMGLSAGLIQLIPLLSYIDTSDGKAM